MWCMDYLGLWQFGALCVHCYGGFFCPLFFFLFLMQYSCNIFVYGLKLTVRLSCYTHAGWRLEHQVCCFDCSFFKCNIGMTVYGCTMCTSACVLKTLLQWSHELWPPQSNLSHCYLERVHFTTLNKSLCSFGSLHKISTQFSSSNYSN
jgi:hypothetical protein